MRLEYIGKQEFPGEQAIRLWNIYNSPMPELHPDGSTLSLESLRQMGVVR